MNDAIRKLNKPVVDASFVAATVRGQREFFSSGATLEYSSRIEALQRLKEGLFRYQDDFHAALKTDLGKPEFESYLSETGFCLHEITETLKRLKKWMKPRRVRTSLLTQPGSSRVLYSPLGVNLIIGPYNYPVMLTFSPLIAALAAGNTAVLKSSEMTPECSRVIQQLVEDVFDPEYVAYIPGEVRETTLLLEQKFDHIFFTGSPRVGSIVMSAAARQLSPVTLELGGKSPCIVHYDANLGLAAKRIVSGKFLNAGQTCVAPDYVMVHRDVKDSFLDRLAVCIQESYGVDPQRSPDFARIVNDAHFERINGMIDREKVRVGGQTDAKSRFIAPTVLQNINLNDACMAEEIFGPVLPVIEYEAIDEVYQTIAKLPQHPLAFYVFSESRQVQDQLVSRVQFGDACINHCLMHMVNSNLPFGGVGESGIGAYHGFDGFERFSHKKGVLKSSTWIDLPLVYAPYRNKLPWLKRIMK